MQGSVWQRPRDPSLRIHQSVLMGMFHLSHQTIPSLRRVQGLRHQLIHHLFLSDQNETQDQWIVRRENSKSPKNPWTYKTKQTKHLKMLLTTLKVRDAIHFNRRGKRTTATLYVGNLEFKASIKDLKDVLDRIFKNIHVEDVVLPLKDGRSCGYGFVTLSWAKGQRINNWSRQHLQSIFRDVKCQFTSDISSWARQQGQW